MDIKKCLRAVAGTTLAPRRLICSRVFALLTPKVKLLREREKARKERKKPTFFTTRKLPAKFHQEARPPARSIFLFYSQSFRSPPPPSHTLARVRAHTHHLTSSSLPFPLQQQHVSRGDVRSCRASLLCKFSRFVSFSFPPFLARLYILQPRTYIHITRGCGSCILYSGCTLARYGKNATALERGDSSITSSNVNLFACGGWLNLRWINRARVYARVSSFLYNQGWLEL